ncbi:MAG: hypothetical protein A2Y59_04330 [Chloroflexi bacterium RBG_13_52_14]|nr:MAG: hypothetical protein A2Y59_04330 [Chloroflexi bacterium RBG_13_52_14]
MPGKVGWILVNKSWDQSISVVLDDAIALTPAHRLYRICRDDSPWDGEPLLDRNLTLSPAEVALILEPKEGFKL